MMRFLIFNRISDFFQLDFIEQKAHFSPIVYLLGNTEIKVSSIEQTAYSLNDNEPSLVLGYQSNNKKNIGFEILLFLYNCHFHLCKTEVNLGQDRISSKSANVLELFIFSIFDMCCHKAFIFSKTSAVLYIEFTIKCHCVTMGSYLKR